MNEQLSFWEFPDGRPSGFQLYENFISREEEVDLLQIIQGLTLVPYELRGVKAKRNILSFTGPYPLWLNGFNHRAEKILNDKIFRILITHYPPTAGIGWHFDYPSFDSLLGLSLLSECKWQMRKGEVRNWQKYETHLPPRSAYAVKGEARWLWQHHIPPVKVDRYSLTFRTENKSGQSFSMNPYD